jgi:hypothetical protein
MMVMKKERAQLNVWFPARAFGFIYWKDENGKIISHFLHQSNIISGIPRERAIVLFQRVETKKGWLAADAEVLA